VYAVSIGAFGTMDAGMLIAGYLGLVLLGGACVAIGVLGSSMSESQIVAFIISFSILIVFFFLDRALIYLPMTIVPFVEYMGLGHHFSSLARGVLDSRDLLYYASVIIVSLVLSSIFAAREAGQGLFKIKEFSWKEQISKLVLVFAALLFINLFSMRWFTRVDMTGNKAFTLSETTKGLLSSLDDNFLVNAYFSPDLPPPYHNHRRAVRELLDEYRALSNGRFHYQFADPASDTVIENEAQRSGIRPIQVKVIRNDRFQSARAFLGLSLNFEDKHERIAVVTSLDRLEYAISSSMKKMIARRVYTIGLLTGLGSPSPDRLESLKEALTRQYDITPVDISGGKPIPLSITVLVVVAPAQKFTEEEKYQLDQFIMHGGRIAFFLNGVTVDRETKKAVPLDLGLSQMFETYGFVFNSDLVADARCGNLFVEGQSGVAGIPNEILYPFYPASNEYNLNTVILTTPSPMIFQYASSVDTRLSSIRRINAGVIVASSGRSRRIQGDVIDVDPRRMPGPETLLDQQITFGASLEGSFRSVFARRPDGSTPATALRIDTSALISKGVPTRMVIVGDGDFLIDGAEQNHENVAFATSLVDWLVNDVSLTAVRSRDLTPRPLRELPEQTKIFVKYFNFIVPPLLIILFGVARLFTRAARRRRHRTSL
jgi:gliding-associated putative ABC transporter substrate-binding component GldG